MGKQRNGKNKERSSVTNFHPRLKKASRVFKNVRFVFLTCEAINTERQQLTDKSHGDRSARTTVSEMFVPLLNLITEKNYTFDQFY